MLDFTVDSDLCTRCGACVRDCPVRIITQSGNAVPSISSADEGDCMACQHCLAVCPTGALSTLGRDPRNSLPLVSETLPSPEALALLMRGRRSVRQYERKNVDGALLSSLLATAANAPTGVNSRKLTFHIIDDVATMDAVRKQVLQAVIDAHTAGSLPAGATYLHSVATRFFAGTHDILFRGAPHALVVSAPHDAPCGNEDIVIALAYFELLAQASGLGTVWWGLLKMALEALPSLKPLFGIQDGRHYYAMLFGVPAVQYARTVQRDDAAALARICIQGDHHA